MCSTKRDLNRRCQMEGQLTCAGQLPSFYPKLHSSSCSFPGCFCWGAITLTRCRRSWLHLLGAHFRTQLWLQVFEGELRIDLERWRHHSFQGEKVPLSWFEAQVSLSLRLDLVLAEFCESSCSCFRFQSHSAAGPCGYCFHKLHLGIS